MIVCHTDKFNELSDVVSLVSESDDFYVGDVSILLDEENYDIWVNVYMSCTGVIEIDGCAFYVNGTENNNCTFIDTNEFEYEIQSGCIAIVPTCLCSYTAQNDNRCRYIVSKSVDIQHLDDKAIYIKYNGGSFTIPTSFEDVCVLDDENLGDFDCTCCNDDFDCTCCNDDSENVLLVNDIEDDFDCLDILHRVEP